MTTAKVFLAGSGSFGQHAADALTAAGHTIVGTCSPHQGRRGRTDLVHDWAARNDVPWLDVERLAPEQVPDGTDVILTAHSHAFIGTRTRARARHALGYHPSLLPLHRGRDAVKWTARNHERVTGGTVYHLTNRVDGGPIALQRTVILPPGLTASRIWSEHLFDLGVELLVEAAGHVARGTVAYRPQDDKLATWEPALDASPLHRPELLELEA